MSINDTVQDERDLPTQEDSLTSTERELVEDLILQNKTMEALIKGLEEDIVTFKKINEGHDNAADIVRFTMQLNIMRDKKARNLVEINKIIKENKERESETIYE